MTSALRATPGVQEVAISGGFPLFNGGGATLYTRADGNVPPVAERKGAPSNDITPGWLRTLGIPLLAGRDFNEQDMVDHPNVILISATGAKSVFGNENPIGKTLLVTSGSVPVEIVGVVGDVRSARLDQQNDMEFYRPFAQENFPFLTITVRSPLPPDSVTKSVQAVLKTIDPGLALIQPQPVSEIMAQALGQAKLDDVAARRFCRRRAAAGDGGDLRRGGLHGGATHGRDRRAHGARRANDGCLAAGRDAGNEAGDYSDWSWDWRPRWLSVD